ncbi:hypothetical protein [Azospirillum sp. ST 5-10]
MRRSVAAFALIAVAACATYDPGNPLQGRWTLTAPVMGTGFALGSYEFRRDSMEVLGVETGVDYAVAGDRVTVIPETFGPTLEVRMIDADTAELRDPLTGTPLTLRRLRDRGLFR